MSGLVFLFIACAVIAVVAIVVLSYYYQEKQRTEQMQAVASRLGFSFRPEAERGLLGELGRFHLFSQGHSRKIRNVLRREIQDIRVTLFDYRYTTSGGRHNQNHDQTVVLFETERLRLPVFVLRPEGLFHKLAGAFGYQDIDFETHPVFSETYLLRGDDESRIRAFFTDEMLGYYTRHANLCTEGAGQRLIFYRGGRRVEPQGMEGFLEQGLDVLDAFMEKEDSLGTLPLLGVTFSETQVTAKTLQDTTWE